MKMDDGSFRWEAPVIHDLKAAELLIDAKARKFLAPFVGSERSVSEAAGLLGISTQALSYWVKKFLASDLLEQSRTKARPGRPIRYYRAPFEKAYVPFDVLPSETLEALIQEQDAPWQRLLAKNLVRVGQDAFSSLHTWMVAVEPDGRGELCIGIASSTTDEASLRQKLLPAEAPAILISMTSFHLSFEDAKQLQAELSELIDRYKQKRGPQPYLARIGLTPIITE